ncbi:hypothetical protein O6P43_023788 [Quillaja saponaria]|uniref:Uncharacterized protein n=1 Tax=Quillaja saponaria TaxID=32244 RepID=A0AAD7LGE5_QUISA|nr:hypothetical protein O6P43_023788 [Quillaja saponaria]
MMLKIALCVANPQMKISRSIRLTTFKLHPSFNEFPFSIENFLCTFMSCLSPVLAAVSCFGVRIAPMAGWRSPALPCVLGGLFCGCLWVWRS